MAKRQAAKDAKSEGVHESEGVAITGAATGATADIIPVELTLRKDGIGGSRIAAVAGLSPWAGPHDVWLELFGLADEKQMTTDLLRGTHLGPALCKWYAEQTGMHVSHIGPHEKHRQHPEHRIVFATPDGLIGKTPDAKRIKVLEVKAPHWRTADQWGEEGTDQVPEHYLPQVTWEMAASQLQEADVAPLIDGELRVYTVRFNPRLFDALLEIAMRFWRDYVMTRTPPPIDASDGARQVLMKLYPRPTADLIEATEEQIEILRKYTEYGAAIRHAEVEQDAIKNQLMAFIGEHEGLASAAANVYWKMRAGRIAWKDMAEALIAEMSEEKAAEFKARFTGGEYRHFQIYPRKKGK